MNLFDEIIRDLRSLEGEIRQDRGPLRYSADSVGPWPAGGGRTIVMKAETARELGPPHLASVSLLLWTEDHSLVNDGIIRVLGTDLGEMREGANPFGSALILGVCGMKHDNCHERHREMERARFRVDLDGYMMRAVSQRGREWSRISSGAVQQGFSLGHLGAALHRACRELEYVRAGEAVFITSGEEDVRRLGALAERAAMVVGAMNEMFMDDVLDCARCAYIDVCGAVEGLREMRNTIAGDRTHG